MDQQLLQQLQQNLGANVLLKRPNPFIQKEDEEDDDGDEGEDDKSQNSDQQGQQQKMQLEFPGNNNNEQGQQGDNQDKGQKKKKKKKKKKVKKDGEDETDYEVDIVQKAKTSKILLQEEIPEHIRQKYAQIEANPYNLICTNFPPHVSLDELREYFNTLVQLLNPELAPTAPIQKIEISQNKQFAVLTCSSREVKHVLKPLQELEFHAYKMNIKPPKDYFMKLLEKKDDQVNLVNQLDQDCKIYMGGLPLYLKDEDVRKLCETFGSLKYFNLVKDTSSGQPTSKGYCFFEYVDATQTDKAIKSLNGLPCGDRKLKVQRASVGAKNHQNVVSTQGAKPLPSNATGTYIASLENKQIQEMLKIPATATIPSRVVQILNMVSPEDLFEDDIFEELQRDVLEEAKRYGNVEKIEIPRPDKITGLCSPSVGKVLIRFSYIIPAKRARHNLSGRSYNKRTVIASFYPEEKFDLKEYLIN